MRKVFIIIIFVMIFSLSGCKYDEFKNATSEGLTYSLRDGTYTVTGYNGDNQDVIIPSIYNYIPVTSIGSNAFNNKTIRKIKIAHTINTIEENAFLDSFSLEKVVFEDKSKLKYIEKKAFYQTNLANINVPKFVERIDYEAFSHTNLTEIKVDSENQYYSSVDGVLFNKEMTKLIKYPELKVELSYSIPNGVEIIDKGAFANCQNIITLNIPDSLKSIGPNAFEYSNNLKNLHFSSNGKLSSIGPYAFMHSSIESLTIPKNVKNISFYTLELMVSLTEIIVSDDNLNYSSMDGVLFNNDKSILIKYPENKIDKLYVVPNTVTQIEPIAFINNPYIENIKFEDGIELRLIGQSFINLINLKEMTIPKSVTYIYTRSILDNKSLENIYVDIDSEDYVSVSGVLYNKEKTKLVKYPDNKVMDQLVIPETVNYIEENAFYGVSNLGSIKILSETPPELPSNFMIYSNITIYVPSISLDKYKNNYQWSRFSHLIYPSE